MTSAPATQRAHLDTPTIAQVCCSLSLRGTSGERVGERGSFPTQQSPATAVSSPPNTGEGDGDLARSGALWRDGHCLVQDGIVPRVSTGEPAYFRVFYVFGSVWCCW